MSGQGISGLDLFGDPVQTAAEGRGRPEHVWTLERSNKVLLAFARGLSVKEAAIAIGVSVPTLRKHYSAEVAQRVAAALRFEMVQLSRLNDGAKAGSVAAEKELARRLEKAKLAELSDQVSRNARAPSKRRVGLKAATQEAADALTGLYETPPAPGMLN